MYRKRKNLYQQVMVIFGGIMVFFYLGVGLFIIFSPSPLLEYLDKFIRIIFGSALILYSLTRAFRTYEQVREILYSGNETEE